MSSAQGKGKNSHNRRGFKTSGQSSGPPTPTTASTPTVQNGTTNRSTSLSSTTSNVQPATNQSSSAPAASVNTSVITLSPDMAKQMRERMLYLVMGLIGATVDVTVKGGTKLQGILSSTTTDGDLGVALKRVTSITNPEEPMKKAIIILGKDLLEIHASAIDLEAANAAPAAQPTSTSNGVDSFRTDVDISGTVQDGDVRQLRMWSDEVEESEALEPSSSTYAKPTAGLGNGTKGAWDQFATNEKLFGTKTNYNEEIYTTKLDRSGKDFKERERKAAALAQQILSGASSNPHIAEERGHAAANDGADEEDKYSGVARGSNAYIPPGARKLMAPDPTANLPSTQSGTVTPVSKPVEPALPAKPSEVLLIATQAKPDTHAALSAQPAALAGKDVTESFRQFVTSEKNRLQPKRQAVASKAKDDKIAEMIKFSQTFKLKTPVPTDLLPLLANDEKKQQDILAGRSIDASAARLAVNTSNSIPAASTNNTPQLKEATIASRPSNPATKAAPSALKKSTLPQIPSFADLKAAKAAKEALAGVTSKVEDWVAKTTSPALPTKLSINPNAKEFRPNANAVAFNPNPVRTIPYFSHGETERVSEQSPSPATRVAALPNDPINQAVKSQPQQAPTGLHPFFGSKVTKKGSPSMHVKEDFSPFKRSDVPIASAVSPSWNYSGKAYKAIFLPLAAPSLVDESDSSGPGRPSSSNAGTPGPPANSMPTPQPAQIQSNIPAHMLNYPQMLPPQGYYAYPPNRPPIQYPGVTSGQPPIHFQPPQPYMAFPPGSQGMYTPQPAFMSPNYRYPSQSGGPGIYFGSLNSQQSSPQPQNRQYDGGPQNFSRRSSAAAPNGNFQGGMMLPGAMKAMPPQQQAKLIPSPGPTGGT